MQSYAAEIRIRPEARAIMAYNVYAIKRIVLVKVAPCLYVHQIMFAECKC